MELGAWAKVVDAVVRYELESGRPATNADPIPPEDGQQVKRKEGGKKGR
jgi:hypothetical protein